MNTDVIKSARAVADALRFEGHPPDAEDVDKLCDLAEKLSEQLRWRKVGEEKPPEGLVMVAHSDGRISYSEYLDRGDRANWSFTAIVSPDDRWLPIPKAE